MKRKERLAVRLSWGRHFVTTQKKLANCDKQAYAVGIAADPLEWRSGPIEISLHYQRAGMPSTQQTIPLGR